MWLLVRIVDFVIRVLFPLMNCLCGNWDETKVAAEANDVK